MIQIANPIYDVVFKYLMEDQRIAAFILSALLKKKVVDVDFRKHEYSNITRDDLSIFRIDFAATIEEDDGTRNLVLVELQKTWLPTETLRFRQYLGVHYSSRENLIKGDKDGNALPMITVYILGHKVGDIEEPVVYVRRNVYDYDGQIVEKGIPNPFIDSLTHDSIIVQIPYIKGRVGNNLERLLSIFDQSGKTDDEHILCIDESLYANNTDMEKIISRLVSAAANSKVRHSMNVEDEYFGLLEEKDTTIIQQNHTIAEQGAQIKEQGAQLKEKDALIEQLLAKIKESGLTFKDSRD